MEDKTWDGKKGTFTIDNLPLGSKKRFILTMYDKSGILSAVSSEILTVGLPIKNATCDTNPNPAQFTFSVDDALRQCGMYNFYAYNGAGVTLPITVYGIIAGGTVFQRRAGATDERHPVLVDLPTGTNLVYWMTDARNQSGGLTDVLSVLSSEDTSCITADSPKVTGDGPTALEPDASELSTGAIAAAVVGTLIAFVAIGAFIFIRKRKTNANNSGVLPEPFEAGHGRQASRFSRRRRSVDLLAANQQGYHQAAGIPSPLTPARNYPGYQDPSFNSTDPSFAPDPFVGEPTPHTVTSFQIQQESEVGVPPSTRRSSTSKGQLRTPGTPRFILHTDAGVVEPREPEDDEVVELPPMYSDTRQRASGSNQPLPGTSTNEKQRFPPPPPIPEDPSRPLSYTSSMSLPRGPRTERTLSFGGGSSVATGYDDPVLERSVSQYGDNSHSRDRYPSDSSQRPLRAHNPDTADDEDDRHYPQYDFLDDPAYSQDHHSDRDTDVQLAYESSQSGGPQHPLAPSTSQRSQTATRPTPSRQNTATTAKR